MEAAPEAAPQEATAAQEEFDADEVAALLWPDADDEERQWIDGPAGSPPGEQESDAAAESGGPQPGAPHEGGPSPDQPPRAATLSEEEQARHRQLDDLEAQLARLQQEQRVLRSELGPRLCANRLPASRLRAGDSDKEQPERGTDAVGAAPATPPSKSQAAARKAGPPAHLICPITQEIFGTPVIASDGHSYERDAIETWLLRNTSPASPVTNLPLSSLQLFPNFGLRSQVMEWKEKMGLDDADEGDHKGGGGDPYAGLAHQDDPRLPHPARSLAEDMSWFLATDDYLDDDAADEEENGFEVALAEAVRRSLADARESGLPAEAEAEPDGPERGRRGRAMYQDALLLRARQQRQRAREAEELRRLRALRGLRAVSQRPAIRDAEVEQVVRLEAGRQQRSSACVLM